MVEDQDRIFAERRSKIEEFAFDEKVAAVFEDMIRRSVPGYATVIAMSGVLAGEYARPGSRCYDLGCSLGATTLAMRRHIQVDDCRIVAVDNSMSMIERCRGHLRAEQAGVPVDLICSDIRDVRIDAAAVVVLNFTLQFLPVAGRDDFIGQVQAGMLPGGALILSEKVSAPEETEQALLTELHHAFKRANGYSYLEISQKRSALEQVLVAETIESHRERLLGAGFRQVVVWMHCLNFASFLALK